MCYVLCCAMRTLYCDMETLNCAMKTLYCDMETLNCAMKTLYCDTRNAELCYENALL